MSVLIMAAQLILCLSILVILHEMGHFFPAKWFGTRVEKFYLFFDPWFELFKYKKGETEYGIGWLPLGGYVKIAGMIDESMDKEQMAGPPQPWEFRSKKAWQRLIIMLGGVTVNFILGCVIFAGILFTWGKEYTPISSVPDGIYVDSLGQDMGLRDGDQIVKIGDKAFERFSSLDFKKAIILDNISSVEVKRNGQNIAIPIDEKYTKMLSGPYRGFSLINPRFPFQIKKVTKGSPASKAGLLAGDQVVSVNGNPTKFYHEVSKSLNEVGDQEAIFQVLRNGSLQDIKMTPEKTKSGVKMGVEVQLPKTNRQEYGFFESIPAGWNAAWGSLGDQVRAFGQMFKGKIKATDNLGSVFTIGKMFGGEWIWERFWNLTAVLSMILGFMNLLPIPALDGGHVMFLLFEVITGKKPSDKFMEYATLAGFVILMGLMIFVLGLDISRLF